MQISEIKIKPLEWNRDDDTASVDISVTYCLENRSGYCALVTMAAKVQRDVFPTIEAAKAAAQSDYEQRIRSALVTPTDAGKVEGDAVENHNAAFDPANDALGGAFKDGFREGWLFASDPGFDNREELERDYHQAVDIAPAECWDAYRSHYFAMLPLAAIPQSSPPLPTPEASPAPVKLSRVKLEDCIMDAVDEYRDHLDNTTKGPVEWPTIQGVKQAVRVDLDRSCGSNDAPTPVSSPAPVEHTVTDWQTREARAAILRRARELWNDDQPGRTWSEENREHYLIRAAMEAGRRSSPPTPASPALDEVRRAATRVVEVYQDMEDANGDPCPDIAALRRALAGGAE